MSDDDVQEVVDCDPHANRHMVYNDPDDASDERVHQLTLRFMRITKELRADQSEAAWVCVNVLEGIFVGSNCVGCRTNMRGFLRVAMRKIFEIVEALSFDDVQQ
jgi:hypothetical protein